MTSLTADPTPDEARPRKTKAAGADGGARIDIICVSRGRELPERIRGVLTSRDVCVVFEPSMDHVLERFEKDSFHVLVISSSAFRAGGIDGIELIEVITAKSPQTQILFIADERGIKAAMSALRAGSYQYAKLPVSDEELHLLIETALDRRPAYGPNLLLKQEAKNDTFPQLAGHSAQMQQVYRQTRQAAATEIPVLITGETGTGKDLVAQAIHQGSPRKRAPFLPVNLGALPRELVASELFGHEKGSFTGATVMREGLFERASAGTVFLDEIASIDEKVQVSLLRLIEQKKYHRLGGHHAVATDARIIAASNEDLLHAVETGAFREDLYYRLDVFHILLPPLRDRAGDIPLLIDRFMKTYNTVFKKNIYGISPACVSILENYRWPGNVRELKNVIQRAVLVCSGDVLLPEHLPPRLKPDTPRRLRLSFEVGTSLAEVEREMIMRTLHLTNGNKSEAAELLGISRRALYNKIDRHGM